MSNTPNKIETPSEAPKKGRRGFRQRSPLARVLIVLGCVVGGLILLVVGGVAILTGYMSNRRFTDYFNEYASQYLNADIKAQHLKFTIWSTFPHFSLEGDSIVVVSRSLKGLPDEVRSALPSYCDTLAKAARFKGKINVLKLLKNEWMLHDVEVESLKLNIVEATEEISNYDILPSSTDTAVNVPFFTVNRARLLKMQDIDYFSLPAHVRGRAALDSVAFTRVDLEKNLYQFEMKGKLWADVADANVFSGMPFSLGGDVGFTFFPFSITLSDYKVSLASLNANMNLNVTIGNQVNIERFDCNLNSIDLLALYQYVAQRYFPQLAGLVGSVELESSVEMTSPYDINDPGMPGFSARIKRLRVRGPDIDCMMSASIDNIFTHPEVDASLQGDIDLDLLRRFVPLSRGEITGTANADITFNFGIDPNDGFAIKGIDVSGNAKTSEALFRMPGNSLQACARNAVLTFHTQADSYRNEVFIEPDATVSIQADSIRLTAGTSLFTLKSVDASATSNWPESATVAQTASLPLDFTVRAQDLRWGIPSQKLGLHGANVNVQGNVKPVGNRSSATLNLRADTLSYVDCDNTARLAGIRLMGRALPVNESIPIDKYPHYQDQLALSALAHSPVELNVPKFPALRRLISRWRLSVDLKANNGLYLNKAYPAWNYLDYIDLAVSFDSIALRRLKVHSQSNQAILSGKLSNLREVLMGVERAPIRLGLDLAIDTLSFNQIAAAYETGAKLRGHPVVIPDSSTVTHADTVAWLVPRNIDAHIHATAKATEYTNLHLYDLGTDIFVKDGRLTMDSLRISASFGHACISFGYDTSNIDSLRMDAAMKLLDVNVVKFFEKYQTLLEMMPQMKNLHGMVSVGATGSFDLFPNMYMLVPSLRAQVWAKGWNLKVHQNHFIRHITRLMLIPDGGDLHIRDIEARANVHDNMLQVPPFDIQFDRYKVRMMGENDFMGHLNYHLSVLESPLHIPFGINVRRTYHNPKIRLGSTGYDVRLNQQRLSPVENDSLNVISKVKYYLKKFVHNASVSANPATSDYAFPTQMPTKK